MTNPLFKSFSELYAARHEPENVRPIAEAYWRTLLVIALMMIVAILFFGIWEFSAVMKKISTSPGGNAQKVDVLDRTKLETTLMRYSEKKAEYELAKGKKPAVTDPSR